MRKRCPERGLCERRANDDTNQNRNDKETRSRENESAVQELVDIDLALVLTIDEREDTFHLDSVVL